MTTEKFNKKVNEVRRKSGAKETNIGMGEELEHKDITHGNQTMTAKIVNAHLKENPKYYSF